MPFGISPIGEIFQQRLDQAIEGLAGVRTVSGDLLIIGNGASVAGAVKDHDTKLEDLLERCRERGIKLNEAKISLKKTAMPYIGHLLTSDGVKVDPSKVEAIANQTKPTDVPSVRRILRMTNYLAKFLPNLSDVSEPLRQLRVCPREDQADVTRAISPISLKLSQMIKVIKLFKSPN